ncbi:glycosyltransferase family 8 protein [Annulohypoxylon truncatum]|uniref:glycosyltransferase family 8 protein n=1 Tax=Annulohypoxylon truncatum TaxID=327061 RepID=UPI00200803BE|nr:glycosyltransferase family 8 protein [Annulohypoxylon truncatum]KAI1214268.1 glycosyltransferase family 8 protein [Annulohypoxylon truncatum]
MAPLWGSSWSSTWGSLSGYSAVQNGEQSTATSSATDSSHLKPSVGQILMSKRVRYAAISFATFGLFFLAFRNYDRLPSIESFRGSTAAAGANSDCPPAVVPSYEEAQVNWSRFAYTQYVTNAAYLCNSVMIFETLFRLGSKADRVMMYPETMMDPGETNPSSEEAKLIVKARDEYKVKLVPVSVQRRAGGDATWAESFTKLLAFNQTQYQRVLNVDSDATILQTMDELFLIPPCPVAMPRAYWLFPDNKILSSQLMLVQPSAVEFDRILKKMESAGRNDYDMEIVNQLYIDTAMILPHRPYDLLTGEFRGDNHENYLGTDREEWDPVAIFNEAKFLHFSDWPVPKPWISMSDSMRQDKQPKCVEKNGQEDCSARELWNGFYDDFAQRRSTVCSTRKKGKR